MSDVEEVARGTGDPGQALALAHAHANDARGAAPPSVPTSPLRFVAHCVVGLRRMYLGMFMLVAVNAACGMLLPQALGRIVAGLSATTSDRAATVAALQRPLLWFVALSVVELVAGRASNSVTLRVGPQLRQRVTRELHAYLQHHSQRFLSDNFAGALAHRISETSTSVSSTLYMLVGDFWPVAIGMLVSMSLLARAHGLLAGLVGAWAVVFVTISIWLARRAQPYSRAAAAARSETSGKIVDAVSNLSSTRLFARLGFERRLLDRQLQHELAAVRRSSSYAERVRWFQSGAGVLLNLGVLWYSLKLWAAARIDVGEVVTATSLALLVINDVRGVSRRFLELFENLGNIHNGVSILLRAHEVVDAPGATAARFGAGQIEFRDVHFHYQPALPIFRGLSISIRAGEHVGLVGLSGSGKSTFVQLLLRQYDLQRGRILIDGHDIAQVQLACLRAQVGLIPQEPQLFHRSLLENIRYGRCEASDAEVVEAAKQAHAHEFIAALPLGYAALVGERGVKLSGGQRQRVAIARVLLKAAPIVVLDEATSSLDSITEQAIQESFEGAFRGKTLLVVAHRLSTIAHLDRILVMQHGAIIEDGSHDQLLERRGHYHRLWSMQSGGFLPDSEARGELKRTEPALPRRRASRELA